MSLATDPADASGSLRATRETTAKKAAKQAGRPYLNLVDNMRVARSKKKKKAS